MHTQEGIPRLVQRIAAMTVLRFAANRARGQTASKGIAMGREQSEDLINKFRVKMGEKQIICVSRRGISMCNHVSCQ